MLSDHLLDPALSPAHFLAPGHSRTTHRTCSAVPYYSDLRSLAESARRHLHLEQWPVLLLDATAHIASRLGGRTVHDRARLVRVRVRGRVSVRVRVRGRVRDLG